MEQKLIKNGMRKNIVINFIVFLIMFLVFDFIIYNQISNSLYNKIDEELKKSNQIQINMPKLDIEEREEKNIRPVPMQDRENNMDKNISPRVISIIRNNDGEIINSEQIGRFYEDYGESILFNKNNLNNIYIMELNGKYSFRCINYKTEQDGEDIYVQLLANVDGEQQTLESLTNILIIGNVVLIAFSLIVSYMLSKRVMKPIIENYRKQTEFVQNASHELRTPLTIIQAQQELLLKDPNSKIIDNSENINQTLKETRRMTKLIKDLMDLARADSNKVELKKVETDINQLIEEIILPYKEFANIQNKDINLDLQYNNKIKIDKNRISELLIILLDNAIKYTNNGDKISIKTYQKDGKLNIEVQDTGIGISKKDMPHIFDRFYRADKSHSKKIEGTGLGLSIAATIVEMHNGTIKVKNNEPKGTIFIVKI